MVKTRDVLIGLFLILVVLGGTYLWSTKTGPFEANIASTTDASGKQIPLPGAEGCGYQPTVAVTGTDAITLATATPTTVNYIVNGNYVGTSAPAVVQGDKWQIVADLSNYLAVSKEMTIQCGANTILAKPYAYADATVTFKDDPVLSSNTIGGSYNSTQASAGSYRSFPVIFQGTAQKSTGKIFMIVETAASMGVNTSSVVLTLDGQQLSPVAIPNGITAANAGSYRTAFEVPEIIGASSKQGTLTIQNTATGVVSGVVKVTFYAEQVFVNANGAVETGIMDQTPNGNNAAKYQSAYTTSFKIV